MWEVKDIWDVGIVPEVLCKDDISVVGMMATFACLTSASQVALQVKAEMRGSWGRWVVEGNEKKRVLYFMLMLISAVGGLHYFTLSYFTLLYIN